MPTKFPRQLVQSGPGELSFLFRRLIDKLWTASRIAKGETGGKAPPKCRQRGNNCRDNTDRRCPLQPRERTPPPTAVVSAKGHKPTFVEAQNKKAALRRPVRVPLD